MSQQNAFATAINADTSPHVTVHFPVQGRQLPADHGYALYSAIARQLPTYMKFAGVSLNPCITPFGIMGIFIYLPRRSMLAVSRAQRLPAITEFEKSLKHISHIAKHRTQRLPATITRIRADKIVSQVYFHMDVGQGDKGIVISECVC